MLCGLLDGVPGLRKIQDQAIRLDFRNSGLNVTELQIYVLGTPPKNPLMRRSARAAWSALRS